MRGRVVFRFFKPILFLFSIPLYLFPRFLASFFWVLSDLFPGIIGVGFRYILALRLCKKIGNNVYFGRSVEIRGWDNIQIGDNVSIHKDCYIDAVGGLVIGNDVSIAHCSSILTFDHGWADPLTPIKSNQCEFARVEIENDVWIGCGSRVLSGVTISTRVIIAAGSIVTRSLSSFSIYAGVPAKKIKSIK